MNGASIVYTPTQFYQGADSFVVTLSDGHGGTATQTVNVNVAPVAPTFAAATMTGSGVENGSVTLTESAANTVVSGATASYSVPATGTGAPAHGTVTVNGASIVYTPTQFYSGADSFVVTLSDGHGGTATQTVNVNVAQVAPVAAAAPAQSTLEDAPITLDESTLANTVVSGATASYSVADGDGPAHGAVTINGSQVTYTPNQFYHGVDSFVVTLSDGHGGTTAQTVNVNVEQVPETPGTVPTQMVNENAAVTFDEAVLGNAFLPGAIPSYSVADGDGPAHGAVTINGSQVTYTPNQFYHGVDSFVVTLSDGHGGTTTQTVNVNVAQVEPVAAAAPAQSTQENAAVTLNESTLANTVVSGAAASYSVPTTGTGAPAHGTVTVNGASIVYTPTQFYQGADSFVVTLSDGHGGTATQTVNVNVAPVAPTITPASNPLLVSEAGAVGLSTLGATTGIVATSATDAIATTVVSGATVALSVSSQAAHGTATLANGVVTYVPNAYYVGPDSFALTVSDGHGGATTQTINVTVAAQAFTDTVAVAANATNTVTSYTDGAVQVANHDSYVYRVQDTQWANAEITNFQVGKDSIAVAGTTTAAQWSFTSDAQGDLIISHTNGTTESFKLDGVLTDHTAFVHDYASAVAALGGSNFMAFPGVDTISGSNSGITITNGNLNPAGVNADGAAVATDGAAGSIGYTLNEASGTNVAISHFGHGDTITVSNGSHIDYSFGTANNGIDIVIDHTELARFVCTGIGNG